MQERTAIEAEAGCLPQVLMDELCVRHTMKLSEWIELGGTLGVDGLEFYSGFLKDEPKFLETARDELERRGLEMPMLCCSPDFTQPDPVLLQREIEREKRMIAVTAFFGGRFCRVLSGQRRPGLSRTDGVAQVVRVIRDLLPVAQSQGVVLVLEIITRTITGNIRSSRRKATCSSRSSARSIRPGSG